MLSQRFLFVFNIIIECNTSDAPLIGQILDIGLIGTKIKSSVSVEIYQIF